MTGETTTDCSGIVVSIPQETLVRCLNSMRVQISLGHNVTEDLVLRVPL